MGATNSIEQQKRRQRDQDELIKLQNIALQLFTQRVNSYHYAFHGDYYLYIADMQAQYELDCMPNHLKYGSNYNPKNHI
jgi:hypothetical protein